MSSGSDKADKAKSIEAADKRQLDFGRRSFTFADKASPKPPTSAPRKHTPTPGRAAPQTEVPSDEVLNKRKP